MLRGRTKLQWREAYRRQQSKQLQKAGDAASMGGPRGCAKCYLQKPNFKVVSAGSLSSFLFDGLHAAARTVITAGLMSMKGSSSPLSVENVCCSKRGDRWGGHHAEVKAARRCLGASLAGLKPEASYAAARGIAVSRAKRLPRDQWSDSGFLWLSILAWSVQARVHTNLLLLPLLVQPLHAVRAAATSATFRCCAARPAATAVAAAAAAAASSAATATATTAASSCSNSNSRSRLATPQPAAFTRSARGSQFDSAYSSSSRSSSSRGSSSRRSTALPGLQEEGGSSRGKMSPYQYLFKYIIIGDTGEEAILRLVQSSAAAAAAFAAAAAAAAAVRGTDHDLTIGVEFGARLVNIDGRQIKLQIWDTSPFVQLRAPTIAARQGPCWCTTSPGDQAAAAASAEAAAEAAAAALADAAAEAAAAASAEAAAAALADAAAEAAAAASAEAAAEAAAAVAGGYLEVFFVAFAAGETLSFIWQDFARQNNLIFLETSAKTAQNVEDAFILTARKIYENIQAGVYDLSNDAHGIKCGPVVSQHTTRLASAASAAAAAAVSPASLISAAVGVSSARSLVWAAGTPGFIVLQLEASYRGVDSTAANLGHESKRRRQQQHKQHKRAQQQQLQQRQRGRP
ncbi:hypothetical protein Emag_005183 [Eimeria magna]